jgi:recombination protein RecT
MTEETKPATQVAERKPQPIDTLRELMGRLKPQLTLALPKHLTADKLIRVAITACQKNPTLLECVPVSVLGSIMQCAQLGLIPDGVMGEAYLVPYKNNAKNRTEAQFQIGYKGIRKLVNNTGDIDTFLPQVVYEGDVFEYNLAEAKINRHERTEKTRYGKPTHFYTIVKWKSGALETWVMPKDEVDHVRDSFSQAYKTAVKYKREDTPWVQHYEAMGMKTVMRKHGKYLPLAPEAQRALSLDEQADAGQPQDLAMLIDPGEKPTTTTATGTAAETIAEPQKKANGV